MMAVAIAGNGVVTGLDPLSVGLGEWQTYVPVVTAGSGSITSYTIDSARYTRIGDTVTANVRFTLTNAGTAGSDIRFTVPFASSASASVAQGAGRERVATGVMMQAELEASSSVVILRTATNAFRGSTSDSFAITITYEAT